MPTIPTIAESGVHYSLSAWTAFFAPAGVAAEIVGKLQLEIEGVLKDAVIARRMADGGGEQTETLDQFRQTIRNELVVNRRIALERNIKID